MTATVESRTVRRLTVDLDVTLDEFRSVIYLMGNHTIAETMYGINPAVMLYAPLRLALYEDGAGHAHLAIDQPSDQFGSFGQPELAAMGALLDRKLAELLRGLGAPVPESLS